MFRINDIYVCVGNKDLQASSEWSCRKFNSLEDSDAYFCDVAFADVDNKNILTMQTVCRYAPPNIVHTVLEWKLNMTFRSKISIKDC